MSASTSKIVSHGGIYLIGNVIRRMVSFVMLPIYMRYLSPADYGTIELLSMIIDVVAILFGLKIGEAVFRFYCQYDDDKNRNEVIFTSLALVGAFNAVGVACLIFGAGSISEIVFGSGDAAGVLALFSFTLILQSLTETVFTFIRAQQKPWLFVGFSTLKLAIQLALNIYFIVVLRMTVEGVILSALVSGAIVTVPLVWYSVSRTGIAFSFAKAKQMASFSMPLIFASLISFYMTFGDRYFLRVFGGGLDEVGVYALGYRFGFLLSFLVGDPFFSIWSSERYAAARLPDARERFRSAFLILSAALIVVTVGVSIFVQPILRLMARPEYWLAYQVVPLVMLAYMFQNWSGFANFGLLLHNKTREIAVGTAISAVLITVGYFALIPRFGAVGAALATALAFGARTAWIAWRAHQFYALDIPWRQTGAMLVVGSVVWAASLMIHEPVWASLLLDTVLVAGFAMTVVLVRGFLPEEIRAWIIHATRTLPGRLRRSGGRHPYGPSSQPLRGVMHVEDNPCTTESV